MPDVPVLRVAFWTLGCRLNQVDTEGMKAALRTCGPVAIVGWDDEADVYVVNSCTVTTRADQETRRLARQIKRQHPTARVVVAGCYAQTQPEAVAALPEVDAVVGNTRKEDPASWLPAIMDAGAAGRRILVDAFARGDAFSAPVIDTFAGRSRAYIKVQDGCDLRCTYCLIWQARGPGRSRPLPEVIDQVARLHEEVGFPELILAGVHLGSYGRDLGAGAPRLAELVDALCDRFARLRLRLGSLHPDEVTDDLLAVMASRGQVRPHLHISLQSGSDSVLARMRRPYRAAEAAAAMARAVDAMPVIGMGADLIVGFPGETRAEFDATLGFVDAAPLTYLHVFRYSPRPGTVAASLSGSVAPQEQTQRAARLRALGRAKAAAFGRTLLGTPREAIVEAGAVPAAGRRPATCDTYATALVPDTFAPGTPVRLVARSWREGRLWADDVRALTEIMA